MSKVFRITPKRTKRSSDQGVGSTDHLEFARRMLVFTIFTGLAYIDLKELYPTHIETNVNGQRFIRKARKKTGVEAFIPLHPVAEQILAMYNTTDINNPVFPFPKKKLWYEYDDMGRLSLIF